MRRVKLDRRIVALDVLTLSSRKDINHSANLYKLLPAPRCAEVRKDQPHANEA